MRKEIDCRYGNVEKILNERFKVHHLYRDIRHDDGDDAGYLVAICEKDSKFYLHIIYICQYCNALVLMLDQSDMDAWLKEYPEDIDTCMPDFIECSSIEEAQEALNSILKQIDQVLSEEGDYFRDWDEYQNYFKDVHNIDISRADSTFMATIAFPYSEYKQDKEALPNLMHREYTPNYSNEDPRG